MTNNIIIKNIISLFTKMNIDYILNNIDTIFIFKKHNIIDIYNENNIKILDIMTNEFYNIIKNEYNNIDLIKKFNNLNYCDLQSKFNILPHLVKDNKLDIIKELYNYINNDILKYSYQYTIFLINNDLINYLSNDNIVLNKNDDFHFDIYDYKYNKTFNYVKENYNNDLFDQNHITHNFYDHDELNNDYYNDDENNYNDELELKSILYDKNNEVSDIYENIFSYDYNIQYNDNMNHREKSHSFFLCASLQMNHREKSHSFFLCASLQMNMFKNNFNQKILIDLINNNNFNKLYKLLDNHLFLKSFLNLLKNEHIYYILHQFNNFNKDLLNKIIKEYFYDNIRNYLSLDKLEFSIFIILNKDNYNIDISNDIIIDYIKSLSFNYYYDIVELILQNIIINDDLNDKLFNMINTKKDLIYLQFLDYNKINRDIIINKIDEYCKNSLTDFIYYYTSNFIIKYKDDCINNSYTNIYNYYKNYYILRIQDILKRDYNKLNNKINLGFDITINELNNIIENYYDFYNNEFDFIKTIYDNLNDNLKDYFYDNILNNSIRYGDYNFVNYIYNDKKRWLDESLEILINNIYNMSHYNIFCLMLDNKLIITESIFDIIIDKYNKIFNINYYYNKDITYQNIIIKCLYIIFNLDDNFLLDNNIIKEKYNNIFRYQECSYNIDDNDIIKYCHKHIIMKCVIDNKYYIGNNLDTYIYDYIDKLYYYKNNMNYKSNHDDINSNIFITLKDFLIKKNNEKYHKFNKNLNIYMNELYSVFNKQIDFDSFKYGVINDLFDKKLFLDIFDDEFIIDHICVYEFCDKDIYNYLIEYNCKDVNKLNKINNILNKYIESN